MSGGAVFQMRCGRGATGVAAAVLLALFLGSCSRTQEHYLKTADDFYRKRDYASAIAQFELALQTGSPNHRIYQAMGDCHSRLNRTDNAIDYYLKAIDVLKKDAVDISERAHLMAGDPDEMERLLYLLEERINPFLSQAYTRLGGLYVTKEDHATAVIALKLAVDADERNLRARLDLALLMERKGDTESAIKEWQRFIKDVEKTSRDDRALYGISEADAINARRRLEKLFLRKAGANTEEEKK